MDLAMTTFVFLFSVIYLFWTGRIHTQVIHAGDSTLFKNSPAEDIDKKFKKDLDEALADDCMCVACERERNHANRC